MARKVEERGNKIREAKKKQGYCGACDPVPERRVTAEQLWVRNAGVDGGFVRIGT